MLPHNGFCLLFVALCITIGYANNSAESISTVYDAEQGKLVDISLLQNKLEQLATTTRRPPTYRPTYRPHPPPPMYWPPYPPPPYFPPPPQYHPPQHHTPSPKPPRPRPPTSSPRDRRDRYVQRYCRDVANSDLIVCSAACRDIAPIGPCLPFCMEAEYVDEPYCSPSCLATVRPDTCTLPPSTLVDPPADCPTLPTFREDCFLYCQTYPNDATLTWCNTQRTMLPAGARRSLARNALQDPCVNDDPNICADACRVDPSISWCPYNSRDVSRQRLSRYELSQLFG